MHMEIVILRSLVRYRPKLPWRRPSRAYRSVMRSSMLAIDAIDAETGGIGGE